MRLKFRQWIQLDEIRKKIDDEAEVGNWQKIPDLIFQFITACGYEIKDPPWVEVQGLYGQAVSENLPRIHFPLFKSREKGKPHPWEYEGRSWFFWLHIFAGKYGWTPDIVADLDLDEAIGLYEEILVDEQLEKEWQHSLSEIAYQYDKSTKKSKFKALGRPDWMAMYDNVPNRPQPKVKIPKSAMPVGNIVSLDGT